MHFFLKITFHIVFLVQSFERVKLLLLHLAQKLSVRPPIIFLPWAGIKVLPAPVEKSAQEHYPALF